MRLTPLDPLMDALADLRALKPAADRAALVRARCHAALENSGRPRPLARKAGWALDRLLPAAVVVYGLLVVAEGLRLAGLI